MYIFLLLFHQGNKVYINYIPPSPLHPAAPVAGRVLVRRRHIVHLVG